MTFDEILDQVRDLLQREKRVSYRALKRRFDLGDDDLEDVKDELIYAKKLAVDEENRVLVWTGNIEGTTETPSQPPQLIPSPPTQETVSVQHASPVVTSRIPEAERRQLTVMFCDLMESTQLSGQLDPEDLREVVRAYQQVCSEVITRFDGHIAQLLGDGLLVYFGYPQAHEDDAHRAVRTGLGILAAMGDLNTRLQQDKGIQLGVRIGIHTGLVVVGEMGGEGRYETLALGEVPNKASRIQSLAQPNTIIISTDTYRLIQGYFECQDLGAQTLRGVAEPVHVYRVLQESGAQGRLDIAQPRGLTPLVGRESEVTLLLERWEQVKAGHGHVVLLTGDAGIGKSRLVQMLKEHVVLCQKGLPVRQKGLPFRLPETQTASRRAPGSAENPRQHVNIRGGLLHRAACFCPKKPLCQKGWPRLSESLAARNNIRGIFAPKNARNMPPFSRQRFMANLCPTAHLSGNALLRCDTTHKAKNSFNALYKNELDGENLSSDLRQTFVASTANLPDKAHGQLGECFYTLPITVYLKMKFKVEISTVRAKITSASSVILIFLG